MLVSELPAWIARLLAFVFGATWGSFFNVAIHRWPREMSVVSPPSHCPACGAAIPPWRNVPLVSWLAMRGKAPCCGAKVSPRYFFVELLSGVIAMAIAERFVVRAAPMLPLGDVALEALLWFVFAGGLIIATFVDLEWMEIPDEVSIGGTALALATATLRPTVPLEEVALGAGAGFLVVQLLLVWSWERLTGERGMGEGDSKLAMYIGAFLGWRGALFALVAGSFQGVIGWGIARVMGGRIGTAAGTGTDSDSDSDSDSADPGTGTASGSAPDTAAGATPDSASSATSSTESVARAGEDEDATSARKIPFGPFLALGALEFLFFGDALIDWYLALFE